MSQEKKKTMYDCVACDNCTEFELPEVTVNCVPVQNESEIGYLFLSVPDSTNTNIPAIVNPDFSSPDVLDAFVAPDGVALTGVGDMPIPESGSRIGPLRVILKDKKTFVINFTDMDDSDDHYDLMRKLECLPKLFGWILTLGGKVYGDPANGIELNISKADSPLDRGEGTYSRQEYVLTWRAYCHPPRQDSWLSDTATT